MESNEELFVGTCIICTYENQCVLYMHINIYEFNLLSSPYLLVFGDDRVCG